MSYKVLALKYRPQTFQEVIGQEHVTTTLSNAISSNRVAHAILLTGPRGTGKTTIARIMAKAMNCQEGPTPNPCNICKSCKSITSGNSSDVFEIDGASNNSVDQIRELRANVTYMPTTSRLKIYIIDEVHMLSTAAFNALLKTLEEPPDHVMFIFATTESHKIPITILSRCQRHDLGRVKLAQISAHLQRLCTKENFIISQESIDLVASEADGSIRDSLSLLDRVLSSSQTKEIDFDTIINNLGIIDKKITFDLSDSILNYNVASVLELINRINDLGLDLKKFYSAIIKHFRNFAVIKACSKNSDVVDITESDRDIIEKMVSNFSVLYLTQILNTLLKEEQLIKFASNTRVALEMVMLKIIQIRPGIEIDELIKRLDLLAGKIGEGRELAKEHIISREQIESFTPKSSVTPNEIIDNKIIDKIDAPNNKPNPNIENRVSSVVNNKEAEPVKIQTNPIDAKSQHQEEERLKHEAMGHPLVTHAMRIFSGNIVDVKFKNVNKSK
ncbi:MAG: DNA polymerase III subunit gamma/tau [Desulfamplus sp.]|nr:DNA polymerase III subunit gamma/tau [Desulfamplus sp.]